MAQKAGKGCVDSLLIIGYLYSGDLGDGLFLGLPQYICISVYIYTKIYLKKTWRLPKMGVSLNHPGQ